MHNSLMGTKNQEHAPREYSKGYMENPRRGNLYKLTKEDSSKSIPYFKYWNCITLIQLFKPIHRKKFPINALVTVDNTYKLAVINQL